MAKEMIAVIGAGTMGAGIARLAASRGYSVLLLDLLEERARAGIARQSFRHEDKRIAVEAHVRFGAMTESLPALAEADWIIEAASEDLAIKRRILQTLDETRKPTSVLSSNTSTLQLSQLVQGLSPRMGRDCLITHFFNPAHRMPLMELVSTGQSDPEKIELVRRIAGGDWGKTVIDCRDTPGFVANRIGAYWMLTALTEAARRGISPDQADAALSTPYGIPKTGVFALLDTIGLDLMANVFDSLTAALPPDDAFHARAWRATEMERLIADGHFGRKTGRGFYLWAGTGSHLADPVAAADPTTLNGYAADVMAKVSAYAIQHAGAISRDPADVDLAMRLGYGWDKGPIQLADMMALTSR